MTKKEKEVQKALGLEKEFVTRMSVKIPLFLSVPIIVKGYSKTQILDQLQSLPDAMKRKIIKHICNVLIGAGSLDQRCLGEEVIDEIGTIAGSKLPSIDPVQLDIDYIDIRNEIEPHLILGDFPNGPFEIDGMWLHKDEILII